MRKKPLNPQSETAGLTRFGLLAYDQMKEERPKMFKALQESGKLNQRLQTMQEKAKQAMCDLILKQGYTYLEAQEIVLQEYILLPSEEE